MPDRTTARHTWRRVLWALLLPLLLTEPAAAQGAPPAPAERFRLSNGLEVVLLPDRATQVVAVEVWYEAGSRHDPAGKAGLAQLFEQLMFSGSTHVPRGGHSRIVEDVGGRLVASVDEEVARFGQVLPSNRLALGLWLEAERMRGVALDDSVLATVVSGRLSELSEQAAREPYRTALLRGIAGVYDSASCTSAYIRSVPETIAGTATARASTAQAYFAAWYVPGNARLIVAGDFEPAAARALVEAYFGGIHSAPPPEQAPCQSATPAGSRRIAVADPEVTQSAAGLFFPIPSHDNADTPALELIEIILARGSFGHISRALTADPSRAVGWQAGILGLRRAPGVFGFFGVAGPGVSADSLAAFFASQAAWASGDGIGESDLARAKQIYLATVASTMERPGDIARSAHHAAAFHPGTPPGHLPEETTGAVTLDQLRRVARTYLSPNRAVTLVVNPGGAE